MIINLNPLVRSIGTSKVGVANTRDHVGRDNRVFYFTSGNATLIINEKPYNVSKSTLAYIPNYTKYRFEFSGKTESNTLICINFDVCARDFDGENHKKPIELALWNGKCEDGEILPSEFSQPIVIENAEWVLSDISKITQLSFNREPYYADFASLYMKRILLSVLTRSGADALYEPAVKILEYIKKNYKENIKNSELAKLFNYHPNHLNRVVKAYTGMTLKTFIITHRINIAKEMLATTDEPITEISENCGFSTPSYFTELFSRSEGITPREYRTKMRNVII